MMGGRPSQPSTEGCKLVAATQRLGLPGKAALCRAGAASTLHCSSQQPYTFQPRCSQPHSNCRNYIYTAAWGLHVKWHNEHKQCGRVCSPEPPHCTFLLRFLMPAPTHDRNIVWLSRSGRTLQ